MQETNKHRVVEIKFLNRMSIRSTLVEIRSIEITIAKSLIEFLTEEARNCKNNSTIVEERK